MKKYTKLILSAAAVLALGLVLWQIRTNNFNAKTQGKNNVQNVSAILKIGNAGTQSFDISGFVGKTALEATISKANVTTNGTGINAYVTSINGLEADTKKREFWEFNINGSQARVGAGSYVIQNHDEIQWKIANY